MEHKYRIYKLLDPRYSEGHKNYIRYIGKTHQSLKHRLSNHWGERCSDGRPKDVWLAGLAEYGYKPRIELVETFHARDEEEAKAREKYWIERYCELGYCLTNIRGNDKRWPQFLAAEDADKREKFLVRTLGPAFARGNKAGIEQLIYERSVLMDYYRVEGRLIADMLKRKLEKNKVAIEQMLSEREINDTLATEAREAVGKPLPEKSGTALSELKKSLQKRTGLSENASLQEYIDTITYHPGEDSKPIPKTFFETYKQESDNRLAQIEQSVLDKVERGEIKGLTAELLKEAIGAGDPPAISIANDLDNMPALKTYLENVERYGDDHHVFYLGKEPTARKREKIESLKEEARKKGWKGAEFEPLSVEQSSSPDEL